MDWFPYDNGLRQKRVKLYCIQLELYITFEDDQRVQFLKILTLGNKLTTWRIIRDIFQQYFLHEGKNQFLQEFSSNLVTHFDFELLPESFVKVHLEKCFSWKLYTYKFPPSWQNCKQIPEAQTLEMYSEPSQTSKIGLFAKVVNG